MRRLGLLLVFAAALGLWLWQASPLPESTANTTAVAHGNAEPGYVAISADLLETGNDGLEQYRLRAERIEQPTPESPVMLSNPQFQHQGRSAWTLSAQHGLMPPDTQQLELSGNVQASGALGAAPISIRTEALTVDLQQQKLDTPALVNIDWGRNRLSATGLHADMKSDSLRLESHIHGEFTH
jgi:LPS export ABC transporter protein LptC